jgi:hypothetical protein
MSDGAADNLRAPVHSGCVVTPATLRLHAGAPAEMLRFEVAIRR